jgi:hypothetical protein
MDIEVAGSDSGRRSARIAATNWNPTIKCCYLCCNFPLPSCYYRLMVAITSQSSVATFWTETSAVSGREVQYDKALLALCSSILFPKKAQLSSPLLKRKANIHIHPKVFILVGNSFLVLDYYAPYKVPFLYFILVEYHIFCRNMSEKVWNLVPYGLGYRFGI